MPLPYPPRLPRRGDPNVAAGDTQKRLASSRPCRNARFRSVLRPPARTTRTARVRPPRSSRRPRERTTRPPRRRPPRTRPPRSAPNPHTCRPSSDRAPARRRRTHARPRRRHRPQGRQRRPRRLGSRRAADRDREGLQGGRHLWSPHDLRHRRISLLHLRGVPWARIAEFVGQRDLTVTANTYSHVLVDEAELDYAAMLT